MFLGLALLLHGVCREPLQELEARLLRVLGRLGRGVIATASFAVLAALAAAEVRQLVVALVAADAAAGQVLRTAVDLLARRATVTSLGGVVVLAVVV